MRSEYGYRNSSSAISEIYPRNNRDISSRVSECYDNSDNDI